MLTVDQRAIPGQAAVLLDRLADDEPVHSNCMFQLAVMLARIAAEPCSEHYKEETAQALLGLIRAKPKGKVVRLFGAMPRLDGAEAMAGL